MKTYNLWKTILHLGCTPLRGFWLPKLLKACNKPTLFSSFCPASVLGSHSKASLHTGITCKPQPHKDSHHQFSALGQVMLLQNTSGMNKINKNPNSKALAESQPGLVTWTTQLQAARAQPQCPKLQPSHRAQGPIWGLCSSSVWQGNAPAQLIPLTPLSDHSYPGIVFAQGRNIPAHFEPAWQGILNVSSSLQSHRHFWQYPFILIFFFPFLTLPWQMIKASKTTSAKHYTHIKPMLLCWRASPVALSSQVLITESGKGFQQL